MNKIKSIVKVPQSCPTLCDPMDYTVKGILQAQILEWVAFPFSRGSSQLRDWTQVSHIAGGFFTSWATREAQEYWIFPTQESNRVLLHWRWILYQLSYGRSPRGSFWAGTKPVSPVLPGMFFTTEPPGQDTEKLSMTVLFFLLHRLGI